MACVAHPALTRSVWSTTPFPHPDPGPGVEPTPWAAYPIKCASREPYSGFPGLSAGAAPTVERGG